MEKYKNINEKIRLGYEYESKNEVTKTCDIWLDAWEGIKEIIEEEKLKNIEALEPKYNWFQFMSNYVQDLEMELGNAGQYEEDYHKKRILYCEEMIKLLDGGDQLTIENTRRAIADSHYALGNLVECDRLYSNWLKADPAWGWGYIGWSDCYGFGTKKIKPDPKRAKEIILTALGKKDVRDRKDVLMRAAEIYEESGEKERAKELEKQTQLLNKQSSMVIKPTKIGRNDPCPCGSGKKYKKCCGAN